MYGLVRFEKCWPLDINGFPFAACFRFYRRRERDTAIKYPFAFRNVLLRTRSRMSIAGNREYVSRRRSNGKLWTKKNRKRRGKDKSDGVSSGVAKYFIFRFKMSISVRESYQSWLQVRVPGLPTAIKKSKLLSRWKLLETSGSLSFSN